MQAVSSKSFSKIHPDSFSCMNFEDEHFHFSFCNALKSLIMMIDFQKMDQNKNKLILANIVFEVVS